MPTAPDLDAADAVARPLPLRIRLDRAATIRALAILGVVVYHACALMAGNWRATPSGASLGGQVIAFALPAFEQLLTVFFILAGYFAHRAYQRSLLGPNPRPLGAFVRFFLWRRFWRLVPVFWLALLFSYFVTFSDPFSWDGVRKLVVNASLLKTLYPGYFFSINHAHWYVAVQWQLDLLYPVFLLLVARCSLGRAVSFAWGLALLLFLVVPQFTTAPYWCNLPMRWWAEWSLGVYLADRHLAGVRVFRWPLGTVAVATGAVALGLSMDMRLTQWIGVRLLVAAAIEWLLLSRAPRQAWERFIAPVAGCSYSLYLFHVPLQQLVHRAMLALGVSFDSVTTGLGFAGASLALALVVARWSTRVVEQKSSALGLRWWRRRFALRRQVTGRVQWVRGVFGLRPRLAGLRGTA